MFWWLDKQLREIRGTHHYAIADLPEVTIGRIVGVARPLDGKTVEATLSGRTCLAYVAKALVFGYKPALEGGDHDAFELACEVSTTPFVVEDDTGMAIVDPTGARGALGIDDKATSLGPPDDRRRMFLDRYGGQHDGHRMIKWFEGIVSVGEKIAVVGYGQRVGGQLRMSSSPHLPLVICDNTATLKT